MAIVPLAVGAGATVMRGLGITACLGKLEILLGLHAI